MNAFDLSEWKLRELKSENITGSELEELQKISKSYEALFSKRSTQIKLRGLKIDELTELDYKSLILEHYSFLKRPVFIDGEHIFIGNEKETVKKLENYFSQL